MPNPSITCVYGVSMADGVGDSAHFTDFIAKIDEEELANAYFVIFPDQADEETLSDKISSLPPTHPLQRAEYKNKLIIASSEESLDILRAKIGSSPFTYYQISCDDNFLRFEELFEDRDPDKHAARYLRAYLYEHGSYDYGENNPDFWVFGGALGISGDAPGIFIPDSDKDEELDSELLNSMGIDQDSAFTICTSRSDNPNSTLFLIEQLCRFNSKLAGKLSIYCSDDGAPISVEMQDLLESSQCTLLKQEPWLCECEFLQLRILQAKTATLAVVSGDKSFERCVAEGLFPIIEFHHEFKYNFWTNLRDVLIGLGRSARDQERLLLKQIINYISAAMVHCRYQISSLHNDLMNEEDTDCLGFEKIKRDKYSVLLKRIAELTPAAIEYWRTVICPMFKARFNVNAKIGENVKIFRMLAEMIFAPHSEYALHAENYFKCMDAVKYDKLTSSISDRMNALYNARSSDPEYFKSAAILLRLMSIRSNRILIQAKPKADAMIEVERQKRKISTSCEQYARAKSLRTI